MGRICCASCICVLHCRTKQAIAVHGAASDTRCLPACLPACLLSSLLALSRLLSKYLHIRNTFFMLCIYSSYTYYEYILYVQMHVSETSFLQVILCIILCFYIYVCNVLKYASCFRFTIIRGIRTQFPLLSQVSGSVTFDLLKHA